MRTRFPRGSTVYAKDGRSYIVEECADGIAYCTTANGAETEFPVNALMDETEWTAKSTVNRRELSYARIQQSRHYLPAADKLNAAASEQMLTKADRIFPGILDFAAFQIATRILIEHKEQSLIPELSVRKCRDVFNAATPATRARLLAELLGAKPDALVSAAGLGENLIKAMIAKGLEAHSAAYEDFQDRPRR